MKMTSYGQIASEFAKEVYKRERGFVNMQVKAGKIKEEDAEKEWAKRVAEILTKNGLKVSSNILEKLT